MIQIVLIFSTVFIQQYQVVYVFLAEVVFFKFVLYIWAFYLAKLAFLQILP